MVPVKLQICNFLSYGDPPQEIDLTGIHMAVLAGNNGAGKSALLDAITWALFGKARFNKNDELIRKGATEMWVSLEFDVEGQLYRIRRRYSRVKKNHTANLEQLVNGRWRPVITSQKVTDVGNELERLLKMDYKTFVNSVFMPQGQSGEFMNLDPAERQDLLAKMLGLEAYEELAEKAREKVKTLKGQTEEVTKRIEGIESELKERPKVIADFEKKRKEREDMEQMLHQTDEEIAQLQKRRENLLVQKTQLERLQSEKETLKRQIADEQKKMGEFERQLQQWQKIVAQEPQITEAWNKFQKVQQLVDSLDEKATKLRELERKKHQLEQAILEAKARLENELSTKQRDEANIHERLKELQAVINRSDEVKAKLTELQKAQENLKEWDEKQQSWQNLQQQRNQLEQKIAAEKAEWARKEGKLQQAKEQLEKRIAQKPLVEERLKQLENEREKLNKWRQRLDELKTKREQLSEQMAMLNARYEQLKKAADELREKLRLLEEHSGEAKCPLCETILTPQKLSSLKRKMARELEQKAMEIEATEQEMKTLSENLTQLDEQITQADALLQRQPEIEQLFGEINRRLSEIAEAERELQTLESEWKLLQQQKTEAEEKWQQQRHELDEVERQISYDPNVHQQWRKKVESLTRYEAEMEQILQAEKEMSHLQKRLRNLEGEIAALKQKIENEDFATHERYQLEEVNRTIQELGYDPQRHQQLRAWLQKNQNISQLWHQLQTAKEQIPQLQKWIEEAKQRIAENQERLKEIAEKERDLQTKVSQLPEIEEQLRDLQGRRKARENELNRLNEELGALRQRLEELNQRESEKLQLEQRLSQLQEEKQDYELLAEAFGRYGIPRVILRSAVQWLEWEANQLLSRLTRGRMHLRFSLETPTQSGGTGEKLTIFISDELGDRPYELYSGGEKFRIDFAVRVALARMLAHRSGAPLRTLVIDEGFGSQDKEGLEALVEAIQAISSEFSRVIVVTHLDELRDRFPAIIEVTKGSNGSQCRLIVHNRQEMPET